MESERNKKILAIVITIAVLCLGIYKVFFEKGFQKGEKIDTKTITVVMDNSRFYTVSSCVSKYINYLSIKDTEKLLKLLDNKYKKDNGINSTNLYDYINGSDNIMSFAPKKMFQQRVSKSVYKYYVFGYLEEDLMDSTASREEFYIIVYLDEETMTFAIEPYNGEMFK